MSGRQQHKRPVGAAQHLLTFLRHFEALTSSTQGQQSVAEEVEQGKNNSKIISNIPGIALAHKKEARCMHAT